ncbi:hypothetical protein CRUP_002452 [Coryphaenoides rupestris]|nr:hypothetical protein CRUP_002452 [Coryphaenoides rupestris]
MMMAARFLRRSVPTLRHARCYAEAVSVSGAPQMSFTFASPTQVFFQGLANVSRWTVPTLTGGLLVSSLPTCHPAGCLQGQAVVTVFMSSGSVTVNADSSVQLLAEEAFPLDQLDIAAAKANLEKAQSQLSTASGEAARAEHYSLKSTVGVGFRAHPQPPLRPP